MERQKDSQNIANSDEVFLHGHKKVAKQENQPNCIFFVLPSLAFLDFHPMLDTFRERNKKIQQEP